MLLLCLEKLWSIMVYVYTKLRACKVLSHTWSHYSGWRKGKEGEDSGGSTSGMKGQIQRHLEGPLGLWQNSNSIIPGASVASPSSFWFYPRQLIQTSSRPVCSMETPDQFRGINYSQACQKGGSPLPHPHPCPTVLHRRWSCGSPRGRSSRFCLVLSDQRQAMTQLRLSISSPLHWEICLGGFWAPF